MSLVLPPVVLLGNASKPNAAVDFEVAAVGAAGTRADNALNGSTSSVSSPSSNPKSLLAETAGGFGITDGKPRSDASTVRSGVSSPNVSMADGAVVLIAPNAKMSSCPAELEKSVLGATLPWTSIASSCSGDSIACDDEAPLDEKASNPLNDGVVVDAGAGDEKDEVGERALLAALDVDDGNDPKSNDGVVADAGAGDENDEVGERVLLAALDVDDGNDPKSNDGVVGAGDEDEKEEVGERVLLAALDVDDGNDPPKSNDEVVADAGTGDENDEVGERA